MTWYALRGSKYYKVLTGTEPDHQGEYLCYGSNAVYSVATAGGDEAFAFRLP